MPSPFDFHSPWKPAPLRGNARSMAQWLAGASGADQSQIANYLGRHYALSPQVAGRMAASAVDYAGRVNSAFGRGGAGSMPRSDIYRNADLTNAYRVVVNVRFRDPNAPSTSRDPSIYAYRTVVLDFSKNPTKKEIDASVRSMLLELAGSDGSAAVRQLEEWKINKVDVITIERRT